MSLLTMSIISVVLVIILIIGIAIENNDRTETIKGLTISLSGIGIALMGLVGFGVHACGTHEKVIVEEIKHDTILKSKNKVYVEFGEKTVTYITKKDYDEVNDNTVFYKVRYFNLYNNEITDDEIISKDEKYSECEYNKKFKNIKRKL